MASRREFLSQLEDQLGSWIKWARELDVKATVNADSLREDAKAVYERRAAMVKELIGQGKLQIERLSAAGDDAWEGISAGAEQAWSSLRDVASSLADQPEPANAATVKPAARKAGKKKAAPLKAAPAKKAATKAVKKSPRKAARKVAKKAKTKVAKAKASKAKVTKKSRRPARKK